MLRVGFRVVVENQFPLALLRIVQHLKPQRGNIFAENPAHEFRGEEAGVNPAFNAGPPFRLGRGGGPVVIHRQHHHQPGLLPAHPVHQVHRPAQGGLPLVPRLLGQRPPFGNLAEVAAQQLAVAFLRFEIFEDEQFVIGAGVAQSEIRRLVVAGDFKKALHLFARHVGDVAQAVHARKPFLDGHTFHVRLPFRTLHRIAGGKQPDRPMQHILVNLHPLGERRGDAAGVLVEAIASGQLLMLPGDEPSAAGGRERDGQDRPSHWLREGPAPSGLNGGGWRILGIRIHGRVLELSVNGQLDDSKL